MDPFQDTGTPPETPPEASPPPSEEKPARVKRIEFWSGFGLCVAVNALLIFILSATDLSNNMKANLPWLVNGALIIGPLFLGRIRVTFGVLAAYLIPLVYMLLLSLWCMAGGF